MITDYSYKVRCYKKSIAMTALLAVSVLSVFAISTPFADASRGDSSETGTEQELKQKNVGSGDSVNSNCGQNLIDSAAVQGCATVTVGGGAPGAGAERPERPSPPAPE